MSLIRCLTSVTIFTGAIVMSLGLVAAAFLILRVPAVLAAALLTCILFNVTVKRLRPLA